MKINIYNQQRSLSLSKRAIRKVIEDLCDFLSITGEEISVYFVTSRKISLLHAQFFNDPSVTDCITFPLDASYVGDLFICPETAITYAHKKHANPYQETILYLVHGMLHLCGYDDQEVKQRRTMRKMEKKCMSHLICQKHFN